MSCLLKECPAGDDGIPVTTELATSSSTRVFSPVRIAERVIIVALGVVLILVMYAKLGGEADASVAKADLATVKPLLHAYAVEHGNYSGMTMRMLQRYYDPSLDTSVYVLYERGPASFCIETTFAKKTWHLSEELSEPASGGCEPS
jgi:hypothetical protein